MKRLQPQQSSAGNLRKGLKFSKSEMSQSMMDLSVPTTDINADKKSVPVPRLNATVSFYMYLCFNLSVQGLFVE